MESGVKGAVFDLKHIVGAALDRVGDGVAVGGSGQESLEDEEVEGALEHLAVKWTHAPIDGRPEEIVRSLFCRLKDVFQAVGQDEVVEVDGVDGIAVGASVNAGLAEVFGFGAFGF